jgi:hypothetical protein
MHWEQVRPSGSLIFIVFTPEPGDAGKYLPPFTCSGYCRKQSGPGAVAGLLCGQTAKVKNP